MPEIYSWGEGRVYVWTGSATASALLMYMEQFNAFGTYGREEHQTIAGRYYEHPTGQRLDFSFKYLYGANGAFERMIHSATAMHLKIDHSSLVNGTGGLLIWSAYIDTFSLVGSEGNPFAWASNGHSHEWDRYGS